MSSAKWSACASTACRGINAMMLDGFRLIPFLAWWQHVKASTSATLGDCRLISSFCFWCGATGVLINFISTPGEVIYIDGTSRHQCQNFYYIIFAPGEAIFPFYFILPWVMWSTLMAHQSQCWVAADWFFFVSARWSDQHWWHIKTNAGWLQIVFSGTLPTGVSFWVSFFAPGEVVNIGTSMPKLGCWVATGWFLFYQTGKSQNDN